MAATPSGTFDYTLPTRTGWANYEHTTAFGTENRITPLGTGVGIFPGRVVWVHDPNATNSASGQTPWNPSSTSTYWWQKEFTNMSAVQTMVDKGVMNLTGTSSVSAAWTALFQSYNNKRGNGSSDYVVGEKIAIKVNLNTQDYLNDTTKFNWRTVTPQSVSALLHQLIDVKGIAQTDIYIYDDLKVWSKPYWDYYTGQTDTTLNSPQTRYPNVHWMDRNTYATYAWPNNYGDNGHNPTTLTTTTYITYPWNKLSTGTPAASYIPNFLPNCKYIVDLALMSGHEGAGVTLCGKNFIGSIGSSPNMASQSNGNGSGENDVHTHNFMSGGGAGMGTEGRTFAAFMSSNAIGQKIVLFMLDGLYGGWNNGTTSGSVNTPQKWSMPPFGDGLSGGATAFPSSYFFSQDPVAIDSVGLDFISTESTTGLHSGTGQIGNIASSSSSLRYADDFLHEEALIGHPPSGSNYDLTGTNDAWLRSMGTSASLGTHEHWNSGYYKQYSRNLGRNAGIELVTVEAAAPHVSAVQFNGNEPVGTLDAGPNGVTSIKVNFDQAVNVNTSYDVVIQKVTFSGNIENIVSIVTPSSVVATGSPTVLTITLPNASDTDSWFKVTLLAKETWNAGNTTMLSSGIVGSTSSTLLDGDPKPAGSGRGYIYSTSDLVSGDGLAGGNAVFYVGSLRADANGDGAVDGEDYGVWQNGYGHANPTAATGDFNGDGAVDGEDYGVWQNMYGHMVAALPTAVSGSSDVPTAAATGGSPMEAAAMAPISGGDGPQIIAFTPSATSAVVVFDTNVLVGGTAVEVSGQTSGVQAFTTSYDAATKTMTVTFTSALAPDVYTVRVIGTFVVAADGGAALDGAGTGVSGSDAQLGFTVK
jgi:hypothetical protein